MSQFASSSEKLTGATSMQYRLVKLKKIDEYKFLRITFVEAISGNWARLLILLNLDSNR